MGGRGEGPQGRAHCLQPDQGPAAQQGGKGLRLWQTHPGSCLVGGGGGRRPDDFSQTLYVCDPEEVPNLGDVHLIVFASHRDLLPNPQ
ncbi:hypothetical protein HaLaN_26609 [Haematococcus lacustris]|uniref:Uncharacterized protein n=1 Tax=Haematococcus lacustris TaxID=44745 RepID=A0A6A0A6K9_HAELA|nr:hypothetical protein HaLaN_26609 [Haematococcus lacustris]